MDSVQQIGGIIGDRESWDVVELGGELVLVDVPGRPGVKQKMRKAEAIRLGLWHDTDASRTDARIEQKARAPVRNKARRPGRNKEV